MKLVFSIVNRDDRDALRQALMDEGFQATVVSTTGGFLREGNATFMIGVDDDKVPAVMRILKDTCHTRTRTVYPTPPLVEMAPLISEPIEVQVGGAVVFVVPVDEYQRF
ncbi:MAG: hypothetical protein GXY68_10975 [Chloroflexi bacterium]|nr:hypothetical protein [Chloroflexota bacterium]